MNGPTTTRKDKAKDANGLTQTDRDMLKVYAEKRSATDAYMAGHPKCSRETAYVESRKWLKRPAIVKAIEKMSEKAQEIASCTLAEHLKALEKLRDEAAAKGKFEAAVKAEECRGKAAGLYVEKHKHELTGKNGGPIEQRVAMSPSEAYMRMLSGGKG